MLFDLRGRGRRNTIKVIYVTLALLMGGGLVLFGIGGEVSGGLVDAITGTSGGDTGEERFEKQVADAEARLQANPRDEAALRDLIRARVQLAGTGDRYDPNTDRYTAEGEAQLQRAVEAWQRLLALDPSNKEELSRLASLMVRSFVSLGQLEEAARAQEIVAETRETEGAYSQLAVLAYQAGQTRKGDLAAERAIELAEPDMRESLRGQLDQAKAQAVTSQVAPTPTPSGE